MSVENHESPKLMAILRETKQEMETDDSGTKMSRKRQRSSSVDTREERSPKTFRKEKNVHCMLTR